MKSLLHCLLLITIASHARAQPIVNKSDVVLATQDTSNLTLGLGLNDHGTPPTTDISVSSNQTTALEGPGGSKLGKDKWDWDKAIGQIVSIYQNQPCTKIQGYVGQPIMLKTMLQVSLKAVPDFTLRMYSVICFQAVSVPGREGEDLMACPHFFADEAGDTHVFFTDIQALSIDALPITWPTPISQKDALKKIRKVIPKGTVASIGLGKSIPPRSELCWDYLFDYPSGAVQVGQVFMDGTTDPRKRIPGPTDGDESMPASNITSFKV